MIRRILFLVVMLLSVGLTVGCGAGNSRWQGPEARLTVSAAASLKEAAEDLKVLYGKHNPGVTVTYNFASSGTLQRQIEEGAPVDVFISAGRPQMDALARKGLILDSSRRDLLTNGLVLIALRDSKLSGFKDLTGSGAARISIPDPETVPAGKYSMEALTSLGVWEEIKPKLVLAKDVRQVLTYVETGNVDAGLVYRTDARAGRGIKIVAAAPNGSHQPIIYPVAVTGCARHRAEAEKFIQFLAGEEASGVFKKHGFETLTDRRDRVK